MVILGKIEKMFKTLFASGFSGVKFNFISFVASICTIVLFVWGFVKIIFVYNSKFIYKVSPYKYRYRKVV